MALLLILAISSSTACVAMRRNMGGGHISVTTAPPASPLPVASSTSPLGSATTGVAVTARSLEGIEVHIHVLVEYSLAPPSDVRVVGQLRRHHRETVVEPALRADLELAIAGVRAPRLPAGREEFVADLRRRFIAAAAHRGFKIHDLVVETVRPAPLPATATWQGNMPAYTADAPIFVRKNGQDPRATGNTLGDFCVRCHIADISVLGQTNVSVE